MTVRLAVPDPRVGRHDQLDLVLGETSREKFGGQLVRAGSKAWT
ncbi:hypothetical protein [Actinoplanes sp. NPDC089786]